MPSSEFKLTPETVKVTTTTAQDLNNALEVSPFSQIDCLVNLYTATGISGSLTVDIETGMKANQEGTWVSIASLHFDSAPRAMTSRVTSGVLKYIRWRVTSMGDATSAIFHIHGLLRSS